MKKMKKILAMFLAMAMILGMSMTTFAAVGDPQPSEAKKPEAGDSAPVTVKNITATGVTVTAYQVVKANYNDEGFIGYSWVDATGYNDESASRPLFTKYPNDESGVLTLNIDEAAAVELAGLAKAGSLGTGTPLTGSDGTYTGTLEVGSYIVLVTGSSTVVYNPMLVGVYYANGNGASAEILTDPIDAKNGKWTLLTSSGYAKSSDPYVDKKITNKDGNASTVNHADAKVGEEVFFEIETTIPSYSAEYTAPVFKVHDEMSAGLTYTEGSLKVYAPTGTGLGEALGDGNFKSVPTVADGKFDVDFTADYITKNGGQKIIIRYSATINGNAVNFDANTNTATLNYSNSPSDDKGAGEKKDITYHYTFAIGARVNGEDTNYTNVLNKTIVDGKVVVDDQGKPVISEEKKAFTVTNPLGEAKFELRKGDDVFATATSDEDGKLVFTGIPAGEYDLVETEAPDGYSLDSTVRKVTITANYLNAEEAKELGKNEGELKDYSIVIKEGEKTVVDAEYKLVKGESETVTIDNTKVGAMAIANTKMSTLPSTGGIGTTIFTVGGCAIMIIAAGLYFASRRKAAK